MASEAVEPTIGGGNDISEGIMDVVRDALAGLDGQVKNTRKSQVYLGENIQKLSECKLTTFFIVFCLDLKEILDEKQMPFDLGEYVRKLEDSTKRIQNVQGRIQSMHEKMTALQRQIARETYKQKQTTESGAVLNVESAPEESGSSNAE